MFAVGMVRKTAEKEKAYITAKCDARCNEALEDRKPKAVTEELIKALL